MLLSVIKIDANPLEGKEASEPEMGFKSLFYSGS
jgi:hypothetical protein